jgi:hypothetical protein
LCRAEPTLRAEATAQAPYNSRAGLVQAQLNGSCLGPARQTRPIWPSIPPHDNDGPCLSCTSFAILLFLSLPSWLYLRTTPFSAEGVGACASSLYSSDTSLDTDSRSGYCTSTRMFHIMRTIIFTIVGRPVRLPGLRLVLPPQPAALAHGRSHEPTDARRCGYGASRSCSWPFRTCRRGGHGDACHA